MTDWRDVGDWGRALRRMARFAVPLVVTIGLAVFLLHRISVRQIVRLVSTIPLSALVLLLALTALFVGLRGVRFRSVIPTRAGAYDFFAPAAAYTLAAQIVPGGAGELTLPVLLSPLGVSAGQSVGILIVCRFLDLVLSLVIGVSLWFLVASSGSHIPLTGLGASVIVVGLALLLFVPAVQQPLVRRIQGWASRRPSKILVMTSEALTTVGEFSGRSMFRVVGLTLALKVLATCFYFFLALILQTRLSFLQVALATQLSTLFMAVPIQGLAGLGTVDAWWALSLKLVGVPTTAAIYYAVIFHFSYLFATAALGTWPLIKRFGFASGRLA